MLLQDIKDFVSFFWSYLKKRIVFLGVNFEKIKDLLVAILVVKRGKYSQSLLNTSFLLIILIAVVGGPAIAENNPFTSSFETNVKSNNAVVIAYNPYESSIGTTISHKPRDQVVDYKVNAGDALESIAKEFDVSVDSIKWLNDLKDDTITAGAVLKIPPVSGIVHKVVAGDNIYAVAKKYKTDAQKIVNFPFNDFEDLDTFSLRVGQTLYVPDGVIEEEKPVTGFIAQIQAGVKGTSNFIWPTSGMITQYPVWYHMALDIANPNTPAILAADTGTVVYADCLRYGYGCYIVIDHGNGYRTLYGHMSAFSVSSGQNVSQGQKIGNMGSTGRSTGAHLHFEIRSGETLLNPLNFLK